MSTKQKLTNLKKKKQSLSQLDNIYYSVMIDLSESVKKDYCLRLIERCTYELKQQPSSNQKKELKILMNAAKDELKLLQK
jgi:hypothetical protein